MYYSIFSLDLERCSIEKLGGKSFTFIKIDFWDPQTLIYNCESSVSWNTLAWQITVL